MEKRKLWFLVAAVALPVIIGLIVLIILLPKGQSTDSPAVTATDETDPVAFARQFEDLTADEETGIIFVNRELVVMAKDGTSRDRINELAAEVGAVISDDTMAGIGFYVFRFEKPQSAADLDALTEQLKKSSYVDDVFLNTVINPEEDDEASDSEFFIRFIDMNRAEEPVPETAAAETTAVYYPEDAWGGANWDMNVPRGNNWGVEAIHAPAAWTHLDELGNVSVGLIDSMPNLIHEDLTGRITAYRIRRSSDGTTTTRRITNADVTAEDHGSHVASIMGAVWENDRKGISGITGGHATLVYAICRDASNTTGFNTAFTYVTAIQKLLDEGVCAINISQNTSRLIGFAASRGNEKALNHLQTQADLAEAMLKRIIAQRKKNGNQDFVICVAAGNNNNKIYYPSSTALYGYTTSETAGGTAQSGGALALYNNFLNLIDDSEVRSRIIVVGAIGIDNAHSTGEETNYKYTAFSNIGDRVDIVAPGDDIYACYAKGYGLMSGTSMATPHVTAAAGLLFAANSRLTGPQVKKILVNTASGHYYYEGGQSSLLDLDAALRKALGVREPLNPQQRTNVALDLCFVIDTTGSMEDDIANARKNMLEILETLANKTSDYRVALVDYRDFAEDTGYRVDYPSKLQQDFTNNNSEIQAAIKALALGNGGDELETVYSGLMEALKLNWRPNARHMIIIMGDAGAKDPEPHTGYTLDYIISALYNASIGVDVSVSDTRVVGESMRSAINVYSIGIGSENLKEFLEISEATGGQYTTVLQASEVSEAIIDSIDEMKMGVSVSADFGRETAGKTVEFYRSSSYQFAAPVSASGTISLMDVPAGEYRWEIPANGQSGKMTVEVGNTEASIEHHNSAWIVFLIAGLVLIGAETALFLFYRRKNLVPVDPVPSDAILCPRCGKKVRNGSMFCNHCGTILLTNAAFNAPQQKSAPPPASEPPVKQPIKAPAEPQPEQRIKPISPAPPEPEQAAKQEAKQEPKAERRCSACGASLPAIAVFCPRCGKKAE